ncbi:UDP-3-O-acyl-N-acetylglucosamine deacetylase [Pendulispora albinea]|uniref:UDP-3-O-acyl-N-acetylglucosamine deacetylase n=1 Tax=Pendulispora albinea TaxID=2741071 RepID=A0ABZ2LVZ9_9BACT
MTSSVDGRGTFGGLLAAVTLRRTAGPIRLAGAPLAAYRFVPSLRTTTIERAVTHPAPSANHAARRVGTVEHLFAAFGGLGIHAGVAIEVEGDELPFVDGAALRWCKALAELGVPGSPPRCKVAREGEIFVGTSKYHFVPSPGTTVAITLELDHPTLERRAEWHGDPHDFMERIAPARTFLFAHEMAKLADLGMMAHVDAASVVIVGEHQLHAAGPAAARDEPARHKLLDLVGDAFLYGGPPAGRIDAFRPGHAANHEAMIRARAMGIVVDG